MKVQKHFNNFKYSFEDYIKNEICYPENFGLERTELLNIFFNVFNLRTDLISWTPYARMSQWREILINGLTGVMVDKMYKWDAKNYKWFPYSLDELLQILIKDTCHTELIDHCRMFLTRNNDPILISTVYRSKEEILTFAKEHNLEKLVVDIAESTFNWRMPNSNSCLVLFNTGSPDYLQGRFNLYKEKVKFYLDNKE